MKGPVGLLEDLYAKKSHYVKHAPFAMCTHSLTNSVSQTYLATPLSVSQLMCMCFHMSDVNLLCRYTGNLAEYVNRYSALCPSWHVPCLPGRAHGKQNILLFLL